MSVWDFGKLYIVLFLHQTTTVRSDRKELSSCISYYSYIKPQPIILRNQLLYVVYRTIPTSNHNHLVTILLLIWLYIVLFLHQTTTIATTAPLPQSCISYYSYIKPQRSWLPYYPFIVVYRTIPTSNHNYLEYCNGKKRLYIVLFLHQTTTEVLHNRHAHGCISYYSYIKPQLAYQLVATVQRCISYYSYIKPQLVRRHQNSLRGCISYYSYIKPQQKHHFCN